MKTARRVVAVSLLAPGVVAIALIAGGAEMVIGSTASAMPSAPAAASAGAIAAPGQTSPLAAGPMLGYSQMREVAIWVQTRDAADVHIAYWVAGDPSTRRTTDTVRTDKDTVFTATLIAALLEPGTRYDYEVVVDGSPVPLAYPTQFYAQTLWQWRTDPPDYTIALASCFYVNEPVYDRPGTPYGGDFEVLDPLAAAQADAMVWIGDNTYLREADWHSRAGILHRYSHTRAYPALQPILASTHHYATWDDHDFGPNNSDRGWWAKGISLEAHKLFWPNPSHGMPEFDGVATTFEWEDSLFVLLDNRYHRAPNRRVTGERPMLGEPQLNWLIDVLSSSNAPFKFVVAGGQMLNPAQAFETYSTFPQEKARMMAALNAADIRGVIFITGDRHRTELTRLSRQGDYPLHDITISPLTAGVAGRNIEPNPLRVDGTLVQARNFGLLQISGPRTDRVLTIRVIDNTGAERWSHEIRARDLRR